MFRRALGKTLGFVGYTIQYGCIAHCAFEYIGEFVVVSTISFAIFFSYISQTNNSVLFLMMIQCSGPSMEPTIVNHDIVFSERMSRHLCKIEK